jgi:hydroxypyruvate reductase
VKSAQPLIKEAVKIVNASRAGSQGGGGAVFGALGDAVVTGPTLTNINDFRAVMITRP